MQEENIFVLSEQQDIESMRPPGHGNNCNGHNTSIQAGGNGHYRGDSCGCDGNTPVSPINSYIPILLLVALILIINKYKLNNESTKRQKNI